MKTFSSLMLCLLLAVSFAFTESVAAEVAPWSVRPWRKTMTIPKGSYKGPGEDIRLDDKAAITIGPGCAVSGAKIIVAGQAKLGLNESIFSDLTFGITLWGRLDAAKCAFDNCRMEKMETYYDTKNSSTKWRFDDCVFAGIFMRHSLLVMDCSIRAEKCTFIDLKTPAINYRNNPADEAQKDWLQFENCRFLRCEIDESFLLCTLNCQFEDCKFTGQKEWMLSKPVSVTAYISGSPMPKSYEKANLKVNFTNAVLSKKPGSSISYTYTGKKLTLPTVPVGSVAQVLGATKEVVASAPPKPAKEAAKDMSAKNLVNASVKGSSGSKPIELKKKTSSINALVVVSLAGTGEAGAASKLTALALPVSGDSVAEVTFNQPVGSMMSKSLEEVAKHLQVRYDGWPRGQRIELSFADKWSPKDGPSAAVACALLLDSMFDGNAIDPSFAVTGDLNADGSVRPIGGVAGKIRGAVAAKCQRMGVPLKNESSVADLLLTDEISNLVAIEVYALESFDQARELATFPLKSTTEAASQAFSKVRSLVQNGTKISPEALTNPAVSAALKQVLALAPNHLSAKYLLLRASGNAPSTLSLGGSLEAVDHQATALLRATAFTSSGDSLRKLGRDDVANSISKMRGIREKVDSRVRPTVDALLRFGQAVKDFQAQPPKNDAKALKMIEEIQQAGNSVDGEWAKLQADRSVVEELIR